MGDIVELKIVYSLCRGVLPTSLGREEQDYLDYLVKIGLVRTQKGRLVPTRKLCELYEQYLACYNNISKKCEWPYGRIHECWMEEWARCLSLLP